MAGKEVVVLRYGHRHVRDYRITTHCCLVARALGAEKIIIHGERDEKIAENVRNVVENWGGKFSVVFEKSWKGVVLSYREQGFKVVHLTMYGEGIQSRTESLAGLGKVLLIIGAQKVEEGVYKLADYNVSVTQQPHSEVAALAIALHEIFLGAELGTEFENAKIKLEPNVRGKTIRNIKTKKVF